MIKYLLDTNVLKNMIMNSITINFKDITVYNHIKWFLSRFSSNEITIKENTEQVDSEEKIALGKLLNQSEKEIASNNVHTHDFVINEMRTKYGV